MNRSNLPLILIVAVFLSFPLLWLYQDSGSTAIMLDKEKSMALARLRQQHALLSERVLSNRSGVELNFDSLARSQTQAEQGYLSLANSLGADQKKANQLLEQLLQHHQQRLIAVETFKSLHAKLSNSLRYLPRLQQQLMATKTFSDQHKQHISQLALALLGYHSFSDAQGVQQLTNELQELQAINTKYQSATLDNFILHGKQLLDYQQQEDRVLQQILATPLNKLFSQMSKQLTIDHDKNIITAERLKYFLIVYSAALVLLILVFLINRFQLHQHLKLHKDLSEKDQLTGLNNRRYFLRQLSRNISCDIDCYGALIFIDLDGFKAINDHLGHSAGDKVLRTLSDRMAEYCNSLNRSDITLARLGGDEFVILVAELSAEEAESFVKNLSVQILKLLSKPIAEEYDQHPLSASLGIAYFPDHGCTVADIMHCADKAMYFSKAHGKNTYSLYHPDMK